VLWTVANGAAEAVEVVAAAEVGQASASQLSGLRSKIGCIS
jgi:hypothetical protein